MAGNFGKVFFFFGDLANLVKITKLKKNSPIYSRYTNGLEYKFNARPIFPLYSMSPCGKITIGSM